MILWRSILSIGKCDTATSPRKTRAKWHSIQKLPGIHEVSPWLRIPLGDSLQPFHFWFFVTVEKRLPSLSVPTKQYIYIYINLAEFNRKTFMKITRKIIGKTMCFCFFWYWGYRYLFKILMFGAVRWSQNLRARQLRDSNLESLPEAVSFSMATRCQWLIKPC